MTYKISFVIISALMLAGCTTTRPPVSTDGFCALGLFYPDVNAEERWSENEMRELVIRNETAEKLCGLENTNG